MLSQTNADDLRWLGGAETFEESKIKSSLSSRMSGGGSVRGTK